MILKLSKGLYVDLESGKCRNNLQPENAEITVKLSHRQLSLLNYFVDNVDLVCDTRQLEEIFDEEIIGNQQVGIKQQIQRIKKKFRSVDPSFDSAQGKRVFQSFWGKGYQFTIPEDGELIRVDVPTDALYQITPSWIESQKEKASNNSSAIRNAFESMSGDWDTTVKAVVMEMNQKTLFYRQAINDLVKYILEADITKGITCLTSHGADGKTTLLASFMLECVSYHPNWNIYYMDLASFDPCERNLSVLLDYVRQIGIGKIRKNILLVDQPSSDPDRFWKLIRFLRASRQPYLYVVFTERLSDLIKQLDNIKNVEDLPYVRAFFMGNQTMDNEIEQTMNNPEVLKEYKITHVSRDHKRKVIESLTNSIEMDIYCEKAVMKKLRNELDYDHESYAELYLDILRLYSVETGIMKGLEQKCLARMDWDDWKMSFHLMDDLCLKLKISEAFPYIAALSLCGFHVSVTCLCYMTGYPYPDNIRNALKEGYSYSRYQDDMVLLRQPTTAENYFFSHPDISKIQCVSRVIRDSYIDMETLIHMVETLYSDIMFNKNSSSGLDNTEKKALLNALFDNKDYIKVLSDHGLMDIVELAYFYLRFEPGLYQGGLSKTRKAFAASFENAVTSTDEVMVQMYYWSHYIEMAASYFEQIPECLIEFFQCLNEGQKQGLLNALDNRYKESVVYRETPWIHRMERFITELSSLSDEKNAEKDMIGIINLLEEKVMNLLNECSYTMEDLAAAIKKVNDAYSSYYQWVRQSGDTMLFLTLSIRWSYFSRQILSFRNSRALLEVLLKKLPETHEGMYWVYFALGNLAEDCIGEGGSENPYYSLSDAEKHYWKAYEIYKEYGDQTDNEPFLRILTGLASLYYRTEQFDKETDIYKMIQTRVPASHIYNQIHWAEQDVIFPVTDTDTAF